MILSDRITSFIDLGSKISSLTDEELKAISSKAQINNPWFTESSIKLAFEGLAHMLKEEKLTKWLQNYEINDDSIPKVVGIVMAGNIPMVGFHDLLCVLISGNFAAIKLSSDDQYLTKLMIDWIIEMEPRFKKNLEVRDKINGTDAVIATGSDNTSRYFEYYFRDIPHIIRKNRTSIAVLDGSETSVELENLGMDIFSYFGLGCRNVSKVYTPKGFDIRSIFPSFEKYEEVINHHKYRNNYDYHKSIYLINKTPHLDTGFLLVASSDELVSPLSVLYHQEYESIATLNETLKNQQEKIQCRVGNEGIPFGIAQKPELWDYADNVDTLKFLVELPNV